MRKNVRQDIHLLVAGKENSDFHRQSLTNAKTNSSADEMQASADKYNPCMSAQVATPHEMPTTTATKALTE